MSYIIYLSIVTRDSGTGCALVGVSRQNLFTAQCIFWIMFIYVK